MSVSGSHVLQCGYLLGELVNGDARFFNRRRVGPFPPPSLDLGLLIFQAALLGTDLQANVALGAQGNRFPDELAPTCFADSIFIIAVLPEMMPLPIVALEEMLVVVAHVCLVSALHLLQPEDEKHT